MDLFDFLILAALALPAIFRWVGERSRKGDVPKPAERDDENARGERREESDFERALREIGVALGGSMAESDEERTTAETTSRDLSTPQPVESTDGGGFSREEAFEREALETRSRAAAAPFKRLKLRRIEAPEVEHVTAISSDTGRRVPRLLRDAGSARQAIIVSELLGRPIALRNEDTEERY